MCKQWELYEHKTTGVAVKVKDFVAVSRLIDKGNLLDYKDASTDKGKAVFEILLAYKEVLSEDRDVAQKAEQERQEQLEAEQTAREVRRKEIEAEQAETKKYYTLAAKGQFVFDGLLIQQIKNSDSFLLPNEGNKRVTAYQIIKRLAGKDDSGKDIFKSYKKLIKFKNGKI